MSRFSQSFQTRRDLLLRSTLVGLGAFLPAELHALTSGAEGVQKDASVPATTPRDTVLKFNPDGTPRGFAGNTVICHLPQQTHFHDAVVNFGHALRSSSFASRIGGLPDDSYHATILSGPNDQDRERYGWPSDIPIDTPMAECNRIIAERFRQFRTSLALPLRFRINQERTLTRPRPSGLQLVPADAAENTKIRHLRDRMSDEIFHYRTTDHDTFEFHISMAYQLTDLTDAEQRDYHKLVAKHLPLLVAAAPVIELGVPEFCTFADMDRFEILSLLRT